MARRRSSALGGIVADEFDDIFDDDPAEDRELKALERRLNEEVDEDLFQEPAHFNTLRRVIDVLGLQMMEHDERDRTTTTNDDDLASNPAYAALQKQQVIVNGAIEHMAVIHCADLNGSVIQVGKVARQFADAVTQVRTLRKQVQTIQDTLGTTGRKTTQRGTNTAMSLRELWLKKLECEAVLGLLDRLDVIRAAPAQFDALVRQSRIGGAVQVVTSALQTMFSDDIAQVQALHKIMEQLLLRKQRGEEVVWETVADVVYLRTAEPVTKKPRKPRKGASSAHSVGSESRRSARFHGAASVSSTVGGSTLITNPFLSSRRTHNNDDDSVHSDHSGASLFSVEDEDEVPETNNSKTVSIASGTAKKKRMLIPVATLESELDLVDDERRCLEEVALTGNAAASRYADPVIALRILVECLARLGRLDDVERIIQENLEQEIQTCIGSVQFQTFERLETKKPVNDLSEFRRHLTAVLSQMGCIIVRMSHLAEVVRLRINSDPELVKKIESPSSIMRSVISNATEIMQKYVKEFLVACLTKMEIKKATDSTGASTQVLDHEGSKAYESGLFSLGIANTGPQRTHVVSTATRNNVMEMPAAKFVQKVLFPKTNKISAEVRHALTFRRTVARWNAELDALKMELADLTGEDKSAASFQTTYMTSIGFLDKVIQKDLLPVLQEEAVNGTVRGLERRDAFDPVLGRGLYTNVTSNDPQDIDMCTACRALYESTGPLFVALHRLPRGGEMYMPLVAVLEHVMLTFISRVKKQVAKIAEGKTALTLLLQEGKGPPLASVMDRRRPCSLLAAAYGEITSSQSPDGKRIVTGALAPPETDTISRKMSTEATSYPVLEEITEGVEGEEKLMGMELAYLRPFFTFTSVGQFAKIVLCSDEEIMKAACLTHSLLKLSSLLESRLKLRSGSNKTLTATRALREANKTIQSNGLKMAKFCRLDMLMQVATRMGKVCESSTLVARDAVRIPSSVNDLGEYMTAASDNLREAAGNAVTAYTFSSLEQYIPYSLMQNVRTVAAGEGVVTKAQLTMNGIEALDRSGSVLYRDLKGSTSFDNSFWDMELAAVSFERSASFMAMMELEMEELVAYYTANYKEFSEADFSLMFSMNGPRRSGDIGRFHMAKKNRVRRW